jgi:hypothetical protein
MTTQIELRFTDGRVVKLDLPHEPKPTETVFDKGRPRTFQRVAPTTGEHPLVYVEKA